MKTEIISGDKHSDDNHLQTFNPLYPRGAYFGLVALIGPSNLIDIHPSINFTLTEKLGLGFDYDIFGENQLAMVFMPQICNYYIPERKQQNVL